jgi:Cu/Ag efflux protein CusF
MHINKILITAVLSCALAPAWADAQNNGMKGMDMSQMHSTGTVQGDVKNMPLSEGVVRKIDPAAEHITIRHGELKNLGMPPMTMTFSVKDKALLKGVKVGDKVQFRADSAEDGSLVVTSLTIVH